MNTIATDQLTLENFSAYLKAKFTVSADDGRYIELQLIEAIPAKSFPREDSTKEALRHNSFSLLFMGPETSFLPQGSYCFEHGQIGQFDLFIVPIGREAGVFLYEVIFNRN